MPLVVFGGLAHEQAFRLARRLAELLPGDLNRVFFSDSGSVAVEIAIKMATQYWINKGHRGKSRLIAFKGAYEGDTTGARSLSDPKGGMHAAFSCLLPQHNIADLPDSEASAAALEKGIATAEGTVAATNV